MLGIELLLYVLGCTVFGGLSLALLFGYLENRNRQDPASEVSPEASSDRAMLLAGPPRVIARQGDDPTGSGDAPEDRVVIYIEHYVRRARSRAQQFLDCPRFEVLLEEPHETSEEPQEISEAVQ
jgi:hypothetical protein